MNSKSRRTRLLLACCAFAIGLGVSLTAFARPCCSSCDPDNLRCLAICSPGC